jgi:hypothetical protein
MWDALAEPLKLPSYPQSGERDRNFDSSLN